MIQSGSDLIVGCCEVKDCKELSLEEYQDSRNAHCIDNTEVLPYKRTFAWVIKDVRRYSTPRKYKHPKGAIIWVNL